MASPRTDHPDRRRSLRPLAAVLGALVFLASTMPLIGHEATWFGRLTEPLQFWHTHTRSRGFEADLYCDTSVNPPREITEAEFAECYRTTDFAPDQMPSLVRMHFDWRAYPRSGVWAPTRWLVRITSNAFECIPDRADEQELTSAAALAIDRALACEPRLHRLALDAMCAAKWHGNLGLAAEFTLPRTEGYRTNAFSAASLALMAWALWPRQRAPRSKMR